MCGLKTPPHPFPRVRCWCWCWVPGAQGFVLQAFLKCWGRSYLTCFVYDARYTRDYAHRSMEG